MPTNAEMLANVPFFALLDDQERATLAERIDVVTAPAGQTLFSRGDPGDSMYVVRSGVVEMWFKNDMGERIVLETARAGDFFGEISLLDGGPRNASALVKEDVEALVVDRGDLDEFFRLSPAAALDLLAATGRRLRETATLLRADGVAQPERRGGGHAHHGDEGRRLDQRVQREHPVPPHPLRHLLRVDRPQRRAARPRRRTGRFDPFPFGLLTMVVSLEAIILSVFVLLSQNRQAARDR